MSYRDTTTPASTLPPLAVDSPFTRAGNQDPFSGLAGQRRGINVIPAVRINTPSQSTTPAGLVNATASSIAEQQLTLAAIDAPLRYGYGRARLGALIAAVVAGESHLVLLCVHGKGPIDAVEAVELDNQPAAATVIATHYLGDPGQGVDPALKAAFAAHGKTYEDTLPGIAYTVLQLPPDLDASVNNISFVVRQRKVFDPRNGPSPGTSSLELATTVLGGAGNGYAYRRVLSPNYVVQAGDVLRYDLWIDPRDPATGNAGGMELDLLNAPLAGRHVPLLDQFGKNIAYGASDFTPGVWGTRTIALNAIAGNTVSHVYLVNESDTPGNYRCLYRNVRITNADGSVVRLQIWSAGPPAVSQEGFSSQTLSLVREVQATTYSDNPALALADFVSDAEYGRGESIDWASVATCANRDDELVGTSKRRSLSLVASSAIDVDQWEKTLEAYAGAWVVREGGTVYLVPDAPAPVSISFTKARYRLETLEIEVRNRAKAPTVVTVRYTNTQVTPWAQVSVTVKAAGVDEGNLPYQESVVDMPGIIDDGHALREAFRRLLEGRVADVAITFIAMDEALKVRRYDVVDYTDDEGFTAKLFRVLDAAVIEPGRWRVKAVEYQESVYSSALAAPLTTIDTSLPSPNLPPPLTALALVEESYQQPDLTWASRIRATWATPAWPFVYEYDVQAFAVGGAKLLLIGNSKTTEWISPQLQEGSTYQVKVRIVSSTGAQGEWSAATLGVVGKVTEAAPMPSVTYIGSQTLDEQPPASSTAPPGDVTNLVGIATPTSVRLTWAAPAGPVHHYEIREGEFFSSGSTVAALVYTTTYTANGVSPGQTRSYQVKAVSAEGEYSVHAVSVTVTIPAPTPQTLILPGPVTALRAEATAESVVLTWAGPADDVHHYEVREGSAWESAAVVRSVVTDPTLTITGVPPGIPHTYLVKAVDSRGRASATAASVSISVVTAPDVLTAAVSVDQLGNALISFSGLGEPQIVGYEMRQGTSFEAGELVAETTGTSFSVPLLAAVGKAFWIKGKYGNGLTGYTARTFRVNFAGDALAAPTGLSWRVTEPDMVFSWDAVPGAAQYVAILEDGGVSRVQVVGTAQASFGIPKYAALLRLIAIASTGALSKFTDEEIAPFGRYNLNEIVSIALPITTGKFINLAFVSGTSVKRVGLLGQAPAAPYFLNVNDADNYSFGYNLKALAASVVAGVPASWFRHRFWEEKNGFFESDVLDLNPGGGAALTGRLALTITKTVANVGAGPVEAFKHVRAGYLASATLAELASERAFVTARFLVATDSPQSAAWKEVQNGDWITARYVKLVIEVAMASPLTDITVTAGTITLDVPDVAEQGTKAGVTNATATITFAKTYNAAPFVLLTAKGAGVTASLVSVTRTQAVITVDTATPTDVIYFVKGY